MRRLKKIYEFIFYSAVFLAISFLFDGWVIRAMDLASNALFDYFLGWITKAITILFFLLVMTSLFLWEERKRNYIIPLWFSCVAAFVVTTGLKFLFARERPFFPEVIPILNVVDYSFPSGHAAVCFAALPILDREFPKLRLFWLGFAIMVVLSRMYLGYHYFSDVIAGMIIGYGIGYFVLHSRLWRKK
ncbi:phosphatase PAP2 family protein [Candidatus Woesearchaeota archaeon]|nr:phosphatase PAP2 family protein [Candidatus Woesearchaeota archaeon]